MMGYNEQGYYDQFNMASADPFNGRRLRPLIPRPLLPCPNPNLNPPNSLTRLKPNELFAVNNHLGNPPGDRNNGRDEGNNGDSQQMTVSSRWNPTPEQLRALEEMYRRGTRTPSADQIQHITAQLRRFGKIEGKNVFYWFQNHKARERQKRRRQFDGQNLGRKDDSGSSIGQNKNWTPSTICSALAEESASMSRAAKAAVADPRRSDRWFQFNEGELQMYQRKNFTVNDDRWQMMHLSSAAASHHLMNTTLKPSIASSTTADNTMDTTIITTSPLTPVSGSKETITINPHEVNFFRDHEEDGSDGVSPTLQLFPLSGDTNDRIGKKEAEMSPVEEPMNAASFNPGCQFYEFLPLKN